jgi:myo-inositol 2-dehydrogenase/D-chiro-inositol 1-dehydrogenase
MGEEPVKFGLLGYGAFGKFHAEAIHLCEDAALCCIAELSEEGRENARAQYPDAAIYESYEELLDRESLDVVEIVLPNHLHHDAATRALNAGCHLMLEKPMTHNSTDCRDLIALAEAKGKVIAIGHEFRLSSLWGKVKSLIDEGFVGDPKYVLVELSRHPYLNGSDGWRYDIDRVGDWILEEPIHFFDLARWYLSSCGEPQSVYALASSAQMDHPELQDNLSALVHHENGAYAAISQTLSAFGHHQCVKVTGSKGAIWATWGGTMGRTADPVFSLRIFDGEKEIEEIIEKIPGEIYELRTQANEMARVARGESTGLPDGKDGLWAVALCEAAAVSAREHREVKMNELIDG